MSASALGPTLQAHLERYPGLQAQDLYKLLYQAALGSEHAVRDPQAARDRLLAELDDLGPGPDDPLLDALPPDGALARVHLRPYAAEGRDPQMLLQAFLRTAQEWQGSTGRLQASLREAVELAARDRLTLPAKTLEEYFQKMEALDFPSVHHSQVYGRLYRPAYRVVARSFLEVK